MIDTKVIDGIAVLHMRHGKANTLDTVLCAELREALGQACSSAKAVVLTGEGKIFSAGVDLVRLLEDGDDYRRALVQGLGEVLQTLFFYPKPVIAAVNGHAIAGGCIVSCAADHRTMSRGTARIGVPELLVGVPFPALALEIMRFATAPQYLAQLIYRGLTCPPEQALAWGLVDELVDGDELLDRAISRARELAAVPPISFELTKAQMRHAVLEHLQQRSTQEADARVLEAWNSPQVIAAMRRYVEQTLRK